MDPTATLRELLDALRTHDRQTTFDRLEAMLDWLSRGGAFPDILGAALDGVNYEEIADALLEDLEP